MSFEEAKFTAETEPQEVQVSTDDLVFMIGESVVRDRQNLKRLNYLDKQVGLARQELLEAKSLSMGYQQKNEAFEKVNKSLNDRILQMEKQLHDLAIERDNYRDQLA